MQIPQVVILLSISQVLFLAFFSFLFQRSTYIGKLLLVFALCTLAYLILIFFDLQSGSVFVYIIGRMSYLIPGLIWLMAFALFRHESKVPFYAWTIIVVYFLLKAIGQFFYITDPDEFSNKFLYTISHIIPQIIIIGIFIHTLSLAVLEYRQDLIESRRNLRVSFVATLGIFWLLICIEVSLFVLVRMGIQSLDNIHEVVQIARNFFVLPCFLAVNLMLFKINFFNQEFSMESFISDSATSRFQSVIGPKEHELKDMVLKFMDINMPHHEPGLKIAKLSKLINIQEYRLRFVINQVLKFHNFSHFLNKYRIKEAEEMLIKSEDSIFNIGINVGYTSLSSFHKAFKDKHGITPKEYRILLRHSRDSTPISRIGLTPVP